MTDNPPSGEPGTGQPPATPPQPAPTGHPPSAEDRIKNQAAYYIRKPEEFEQILGTMQTMKPDMFQPAPAQAPAVDPERLTRVELENARLNASLDYGLTREDAKALTGRTPDEIKAQAEYWAARLKTTTPPPAGEPGTPPAPPKPGEIKSATPPPPAPAPKPPLPSYTGEQINSELQATFQGTGMVITPAVSQAFQDLKESMAAGPIPMGKE